MATENSVLNDTRTPGFICSMKCSWNRFLNSDCSENSSLCTGSNKKWLEESCSTSDVERRRIQWNIICLIEWNIRYQQAISQVYHAWSNRKAIYRGSLWQFFLMYNEICQLTLVTGDCESLVWEIRFIQFLLINLSTQGYIYNSFYSSPGKRQGAVQ